MRDTHDMPYNVEVEQAVLGILLTDPRRIDDALDQLTESDFITAVHQRIFTTIANVTQGGQVASPITLRPYFENDEDLKEAKGAAYLADLAANSISSVNLKDYMATLRDLRLRRRMMDISDMVIHQAKEWEFGTKADDILDQAEAALFDLAEEQIADDGPVMMNAVMSETVQHIDNVQKGVVSGLMTGLAELDRITTGFWASDLVILAGRPSMGKTALAMTIALNAAIQKNSVLYFSLEMTKAQMGQRYIARFSDIATGMQNRKGAFKDHHYSEMIKASGELMNMPMAIDDKSGLTVHQIRSRARRYKRKYGLNLIVVDQLNLIDMSKSRYINKVDQFGEVTRALKVMAKDLGAPVLLLHQLNRDIEKREDKRPMLADLRDSGNLEQDADTVIFVHRDEYYLERNPPKKRGNESDEKFSERSRAHEGHLEQSRGKADIIAAKVRQGEPADAHVMFNGKRQIFYDREGMNYE